MTHDQIITLAFGIAGMLLGGVLGPSFAAIAEHRRGGARDMDSLLGDARRIAGHRTRRKTTKISSTSDNDALATLSFAIVVTVILYVKVRPWILFGLASVAVLVFLVSACVSWVAWRRNVIAGTKAGYLCFVLPGALTAAGAINAKFLWDGRGASPAVQRVLASCDLNTGSPGINGITFIAYEVLGATIFSSVALISIWYSISQVAAIYTVENARPRWLWRRIYRLSTFGGTWSMIAFFSIFGVFSVIACAGLLYEGVEALSRIGQSIGK